MLEGINLPYIYKNKEGQEGLFLFLSLSIDLYCPPPLFDPDYQLQAREM